MVWKEYARILIPSLRRTLLPSLNASWRKDASSPKSSSLSSLGPRPWIFRPRLLLSFRPSPAVSPLSFSFFLSIPARMRPFWRSGYRCYARRAPRRSTNGFTKSYEDSRGCTIVRTSRCATVLRYSGWCPAVLRIDYTVRSFARARERNRMAEERRILSLHSDRRGSPFAFLAFPIMLVCDCRVLFVSKRIHIICPSSSSSSRTNEPSMYMFTRFRWKI